jgi:hypothetical protein
VRIYPVWRPGGGWDADRARGVGIGQTCGAGPFRRVLFYAIGGATSRHFPPTWLAAICAGCDVSAPTGACRLHKRRPCPEFYFESDGPVGPLKSFQLSEVHYSLTMTESSRRRTRSITSRGSSVASRSLGSIAGSRVSARNVSPTVISCFGF